MKKNIFIAATFIAFVSGFSSCSKCYDCVYEVQTQGAGGTVVTEKDTDEYCTASSEEIKKKESQGYDCTAK